jgi:hypothetical protein
LGIIKQPKHRVDRNNKVTENWKGEDQDKDEQDVEEDSSDDEERLVNGSAVEENGGNSRNRMRCVSTEAGGSDEISSVTTGRTKVTDVDSF